MELSPMKAIIVEDEAIGRETLAGYLDRYCPQIKLEGMAESVSSGLALIKKHQPDIVFLDVEMPFGNGFDLLEQVGEVKFETVFVTAYSHYAVKALNMSASYYLLKPIDIDELVRAVEKIHKARAEQEHGFHARILAENIRTEDKQTQKLVLPTLEGFELAKVGEVVRCEAKDNFTQFHFTDGRRLLICRTLKFYEELLSEFDFMRVHKSHMVNLQHIRKYKKGKGGQLIMSDNSEVEVSPQKKAELLERF